MRIETLPSPGNLSMGLRLRTEAAKAISAVEILAGFTAGKSTAAKPLSDFFTACATALADFVEAVAPTVASVAIFVDKGVANKIRIRHSEGLNPSFVPAPAAFVLADPTKVISKVEIDGPDVILTVTVAYTASDVAPTLDYTQPGAGSNLRDISGNLVASYVDAAVTNPLV